MFSGLTWCVLPAHSNTSSLSQTKNDYLITFFAGKIVCSLALEDLITDMWRLSDYGSLAVYITQAGFSWTPNRDLWYPKSALCLARITHISLQLCFSYFTFYIAFYFSSIVDLKVAIWKLIRCLLLLLLPINSPVASSCWTDSPQSLAKPTLLTDRSLNYYQCYRSTSQDIFIVHCTFNDINNVLIIHLGLNKT